MLKIRSAIITFSLFCCLSSEAQISYDSDQVSDIIRAYIEIAYESGKLKIGDLYINSPDEVIASYEINAYRPLWEDPNAVDEFLQELGNVSSDGLNPESFKHSLLQTLYVDRMSSVIPDAELSAIMDLLLTDAFYTAGRLISSGIVDPIADVSWHLEPRSIDLEQYFDLGVNIKSPALAFDLLRPRYPQYDSLRSVVVYYDSLNQFIKNWPQIKNTEKIEIGDEDERISIIREQLNTYREYSVPDSGSVYDSVLFKAVQTFQNANGLEPDGIIGKETFAALNLSPFDRLKQVLVTMERLRWMPYPLEERHMLVNIPGFYAELIDSQSVHFRARIIVGKNQRSTPVFQDEISHIVFNPYWVIPPTILREDVWPLMTTDSTYLAKKDMRIVAFGGEVVDPSTLNWADYTPDRFPYMVRQEPGPTNPLGQIKFLFPNKYQVYLHDTPNKSLFNKSQRTFSSGCIRVDAVQDLAHIMLEMMNSPLVDSIPSLLTKKKEIILYIREPIPIYITYMTVWVDPSGTIQFRNDVYGRDGLVWDEMLKQDPFFRYH